LGKVKIFGSFNERGPVMKIRKKILDYDYEEVLDTKTRELIRVGCAVAVGCPT
jgi:alkylhydroperoxidase/carboxymuconolactone decarboxylase family protein YurZ